MSAAVAVLLTLRVATELALDADVVVAAALLLLSPGS